MSDTSDIERLKTTPITELNLGNASLKRAIKRAGFDTFPELMGLSEKEIDDLFDWKDADSIIRLQEQYRANPEEFAKTVLQKREIDKEAIDSILSKVERPNSAPRTSTTTATSRYYFSGDGPTELPLIPCSEALKGFEKRASEAFDDLDDRFEDVMVYQVFDEFSTDLDELSDAFLELLAHYPGQPRAALNLIDRHLRNAFVVFVADRARNVYKDGNLWGNFFEDLGIQDGNAQSLFKQTFVDHIERRKMPLYARDEETNYYFYTALLHGGLSADSWSELWEKSILRLAKEIGVGHYDFFGEMDGHSILKEIKNPESDFAPKKTVLNILEKAPDSTIAPLFEAALQVAVQFNSLQGNRDEYMMLSNFGLPEAAMEALLENQDQKTGSGLTSSSRNKGQHSKKIGSLPMANLQLDLAEGVVLISWPSQEFPLHFSGARIDYYVNGKMELSSDFRISVGKCILEAVNISVEPQARYDVELKLMQLDERTGEYFEKMSLPQIITRSKPGCFEFIKDARGRYCLRGRNQRILKKRRVAFIVEDGYRIEPGQGMSAVLEYEATGDWNSTQIFIYDVSPGSAGSIVNNLTNEEAAAWQERYVAKIDKSRIIGETADGIDLYGFVPNKLGTNGGLPSVTIEAIDGLNALDDLEILCICDGRRVSIPRHVVWADNYGDSTAAQIALVPQESSLFDWHIEECLIEARQKSAGDKAVFKYRFAVVPIRDFKPTSISFDFGVAVAEYEFQSMLEVDITNTQRETETIHAWGRYSARTLLKDEFLNLRIRSIESCKETNAKLALAAIAVKIPDPLLRVAKERPVCLADALDLGPKAANFKILTYGRRHHRAVLVMLGLNPVFFRELKQLGVHEFNLFEHKEFFQQADGKPPESIPLKLSLIYGDDVTQGYLTPAWTDIEILDCAQGIGISSWELFVASNGDHILRFEGIPVCDMCFQFRTIERGKLIAQVSVNASVKELVLPTNVVRFLDVQDKVFVEMSPTDWLGEFQCEYATRFILKR